MKHLKILKDYALLADDNERTDGLGFNLYADILSDIVVSNAGPFTIGIFGEWGTGKTSLMRLIENRISNREENVVPIWFNPWRFEKQAHPIVPLVATIRHGFEDYPKLSHERKQISQPFFEKLVKIACSLSVNAEVKLPFAGEVKLSILKKKDEKQKILDLMNDDIYFKAFEALSSVSSLLGNLKLMVIIDDLDRCFPDTVIRILETIKLVLSQPGFIFVLGVSRKVIDGFLKYRYSKRFGIEEFEASRYLDKIIQLPFYIPSNVARRKMSDFTRQLLNEINQEHRTVLNGMVTIINPISYNNPRDIIRNINSVLIDYCVYDSQSESMQQSGGQTDAKKIPIDIYMITKIMEKREDIIGNLRNNDDLCKEILKWNGESDVDKVILECKNEPVLSEDKKTAFKFATILKNDTALLEFLIVSGLGKKWLQLRELWMEEDKSLITARDMALIHSSWKAPQYDTRFDKKMYRFDAVIEANAEILDMIEYVTYDLSSGGYPDPIRKITERGSRFKLKELAWGSSTLRAEVKIKNQEEPIKLQRIISLSDIGPRI